MIFVLAIAARICRPLRKLRCTGAQGQSQSADLDRLRGGLSEFGAAILFTGNLPGVPQTMPLAIYLGVAVVL